MSAAEQIAVAWQALGRTLAAARQAPLWVPWLAIGAIQLAIVAALWGFAHPWVSWFMAPLLRLAGGEEILRYPNALLGLPGLVRRSDLSVVGIAGSVLVGASTLLFAARFQDRPAAPRGALAAAVRRAAPLVLTQLPGLLLLLALAPTLESLAGSEGGRLRRLAGLAVAFSIPVVTRSLLLYLPPLVMLEGAGALRALRDLPRTWARGLWAALFLGFVLALPVAPLDLLAAGSADPEAIGWIVAARAVVGVGAGFLLAGSATLTYLSALSEPESERP